MPVQRGFAMIAILALIALISAFLIASALNRTPADVSNEREDRSMSALRKAKAALIAYAANEQWQLYYTPGTYFQPGALACPDQDDNGTADCITPFTSSLIGRVPYKTIGLDDLRDASGERLWYALSHDFRKLRCTSFPPLPPTPLPSGCTIINSDTKGQLTVVGIAPATQVVAVLFAPGEALQGQNRDPANTSAHNDPLNYLEGPPNLDLPARVNFVFTTASPSATFNDRVLVITQAELMDAVEPVVAANIQRDIVPLVQAYFAKWGAYPFAVTFAAPPATATAYKGTPSPPAPAPGENKGLLPLTDDPTWFKWASATVTQIGGTGSPTVNGSTCSILSSPLRAVCRVDYDGPVPDQARPNIKLQVFLQNANTSFADMPSPITAAENLIMVDHDSIPLTNQGSPYGQWTKDGLPPLVPTQTFDTQTAVVAQTGVLTYIGRLQNAQDTSQRVFITVPLSTPNYLPITSIDPAVNPSGSWFISNQWYRQVYYAVSPGYVSGGVVPVGTPASCNPPPSCLTVNNLVAPTNDKHAIIVLTGRALDGQDRIGSPGNLLNYLEGQNSTPADLIFEHRAGPSPTINDRVVVVAP